MSVFKHILIVAIVFSCVSVKGQTTVGRLSLQEAVDIAVKNNIQVKQAGLKVETADINRKQARANMLPNLNGDFNYGWNNGRNIDPFLNVYVNQQLTGSNIGLTSQWVLFNGLQVQNLIKQNTLSLEASKMDLQQNKETLTMNVILNYLQVLSNEDILVNLENQAAVTKNQVERLEVLVREGAKGQYQLSDMKGQYANDKVAIVNARNSLEISKMNFCQLLNMPYSKDLTLERNDAPMPTEMYAGTPEDIYNKATDQLALVKAGGLRVESAKRAIKVERGAYFPRIGLYGNLFSNYSSTTNRNIAGAVTDVLTDNYVLVNNVKSPVYTPRQQFTSEGIPYFDQMKNNIGSSFGVGATIPLFNNFRTKYRVDQAKVVAKNAELEKQQIDLNLKQQVDQAYVNMVASYNRYTAFQEQYNEYMESFRANEIRFNTGAINSFEYLSAKNNLDRARLSLTQVRYEYIFRTKILDYFQGMLSY
ncbi:MAG TPA: TolC family protein [Chitinophagaceae bacterium]|nr:TolC family protein [Chitinophagaceae bacterium]